MKAIIKTARYIAIFMLMIMGARLIGMATVYIPYKMSQASAQTKMENKYKAGAEIIKGYNEQYYNGTMTVEEITSEYYKLEESDPEMYAVIVEIQTYIEENK